VHSRGSLSASIRGIAWEGETMETPSGAEGEVLRACQLGDRVEVAGDDVSGHTSPAGDGNYWEAGRDGARGSGRPGRKRTRPAQGTPLRQPKGAAAAGDSRAGWSRGDPTGRSDVSHDSDARPPLQTSNAAHT
jgi:hypothetical protein